jgi:hypothetical protein
LIVKIPMSLWSPKHQDLLENMLEAGADPALAARLPRCVQMESRGPMKRINGE